MKVLIAAHHGDAKERERAFDLVNKLRIGGVSFLVADLNNQVINLDVLRLRLRHADALVIVQSSFMLHQAPLQSESEAHRAERLAIEAAVQADKVCGVIGKNSTLLSAHMRSFVDKINIVGPFCESRDVTGGLADSFSVAEVIHVSDMDRGVQGFMARLEISVSAYRKKPRTATA